MADTPPIDIRPDHWAIVQGILNARVPGQEVWAFGSRAKWTAKEFSDLDLAVIGETPLPLAVFAELHDDFAESDLPWKVDVVDWATTAPEFRAIIERDKVVVRRGTPPPSPSISWRRDMASEWRDVTIEEIAAKTRNALVGGPFGSNLVSNDYAISGIPVIRGQNMGGRWISGEFVFVSSEKAASLEANTARPGDIIFTQRGTLGQVSVVPEGAFERYIVSQSQMKLTVNRDSCDPLFFYYVFSTDEQQDYIRQNAIQTGVPHTNLGILRTTLVPLPSLTEQRAIAHILGTLDDKIELNRRMNETLEAMARALFKSWFVDFDPVRAKMEGRSTGLPQPISDLFPDRFEDSALGAIPKGWSVKPLQALTAYLSRGISPTYIDVGGICVLNQKCIRNHNVDFTKSRRHDPQARSIFGREIKVGDIVVNSTGVGTLGRAAQILDLPEPLIADSHVTIVRASEIVDLWFLGRLLVTREEEIEGLGEGSTGQTELSRTSLGGLPCVVPSADLQQKFGIIVGSLLSRVSANTANSWTLEDLRDTLLPKLISGELRVKDAEKFLERVR